MTKDERDLWKRRIKNMVWATLKATGRRPTKRELSQTVNEMLKLQPKPKENWREKKEPQSIKQILGVK